MDEILNAYFMFEHASIILFNLCHHLTFKVWPWNLSSQKLCGDSGATNSAFIYGKLIKVHDGT
jgi:hypothetical protein